MSSRPVKNWNLVVDAADGARYVLSFRHKGKWQRWRRTAIPIAGPLLRHGSGMFIEPPSLKLNERARFICVPLTTLFVQQGVKAYRRVVTAPVERVTYEDVDE